MKYTIRIHENINGKGMRLAEFHDLLLRYLERKKESDPLVGDHHSRYILRNGLDVTLFHCNQNGVLEMRVSGDLRTFGMSIDAIYDRYIGHIEIKYHNE